MDRISSVCVREGGKGKGCGGGWVELYWGHRASVYGTTCMVPMEFVALLVWAVHTGGFGPRHTY